MAPGRPKALPEWSHTKEYLVILLLVLVLFLKEDSGLDGYVGVEFERKWERG